MFGAHITVKALFILIFCWMASSSNTIPENTVLSPKAKDRVFVTLSDIHVENVMQTCTAFVDSGWTRESVRQKSRSQQSLFMKLRPKPKRMRLFSSDIMAIMQQSSGSFPSLLCGIGIGFANLAKVLNGRTSFHF